MRTSLIGFVLLALTGCATGAKSEVDRIATQYHEHVYALWTNDRGVALVMRDCPTLAPGGGDEHTGEYRKATHPPCADVAATTDPADVDVATRCEQYERHTH